MSNPLWTTFGNYQVMCDSDTFRIFPKGRDGATRPVTISRLDIVLKHKCGEEIRIRRHLHQGKWKWNDSRVGSVAESHVLSEAARLLYNGNEARAAEQLARFCVGHPLSA